MPTPFPKRRSTRAALAVGALLLLGIMLIPRWREVTSPVAKEGGADETGGTTVLSAKSSPSKSERPKAGQRPRRAVEEAFSLLQDPTKRGLSAEEIADFVSSRNRSVDSLLSAFRLGGDQAYLKEAVERFPDHPQVLVTSLAYEQSPEQRLAILENLKRVDPGNGLGNCMTAAALVELGRKQEAMDEIQAAIGKPFGNFAMESALNDEEAYLASGVPSAQAKMMALFGLNNPHILKMRGLADGMRTMIADYQAAGDGESAEALRAIQVELGQQLQGSGNGIDLLVGMLVEKKALEGVDSQEASARLEELARQKQSFTGRSEQVMSLVSDPAVPEGDWLLYFDRVKLFGESAANEWMLEKHPQR